MSTGPAPERKTYQWTSEPSGPGMSPGQPFLNVVPVDLGLISDCTSNLGLSGTLKSYVQIVGVGTGATGLLASDNPGVEFEFRNKAGGGAYSNKRNDSGRDQRAISYAIPGNN